MKIKNYQINPSFLLSLSFVLAFFCYIILSRISFQLCFALNMSCKGFLIKILKTVHARHKNRFSAVSLVLFNSIFLQRLAAMIASKHHHFNQLRSNQLNQKTNKNFEVNRYSVCTIKYQYLTLNFYGTQENNENVSRRVKLQQKKF